MAILQRQTFSIRIESQGHGRASIQLQEAPVGAGARHEVEVGSLIHRYRELSAWLRLSDCRGVELLPSTVCPDGLPSALRKLGAELYQALLGGPLLEPFSICLDRARHTPGGLLTLKLHFVPSEPGALDLITLPWELLYHSDCRSFLARSDKTPLVRLLDIPQLIAPPTTARPSKALLVRCCPRSAVPLRLGEETARIREILSTQTSTQVDELVSPSLVALLDRMAGERYSLVHFMGHGSFNEATGEGALHFEDEAGGPLPVSGITFAEALRDCPDLSLVVLNACNTGRASSWPAADPFTGVAAALVIAGVPAVLAMQRPVTDEGALQMASRLYSELAKGLPLDAAVSKTRRALYLENPTSWEWATPALFARIDLDRVLRPRRQEFGSTAERTRLAATDLPPHSPCQDGPLAPAFEVLQGRRPGELSWSEVKLLERHLQAALDLESECPMVLILIALVKLDFHRRKGYHVAEPSPEELLGRASRLPGANEAVLTLSCRLALTASLLGQVRACLRGPVETEPSLPTVQAEPLEPLT
jgi:hypothetical protein